ncbi:universal stress protein (plasmid) [Paroceanicella profunda]|uniref:Universal stress protein n=1 Tax=Paroceanicella profunda TaxID=2579971 RepID=A0A5B8G2T3_9RHOB|nr:universal stress protein [Paroceanicella profunda]QDL94404.1 universal stress protein [Paroceanicella profunda]
MSYKTILNVCDETGSATPGYQLAVALAGRFDAHLELIACGLEPELTMYAYDGVDAGLIAEMGDRARGRADAIAASAEALLSATGLRSDVRRLVTSYDRLQARFGAYARYADLVVLDRPKSTDDTVAERLLEGALFDGDATVLLCPQTETPGPVPGDSVVIAWNGSAESLRAVRGAMPFLAQAQRVDIVLVDPEPDAELTGEDPGSLLALMLARQGLHVSVTPKPSSGRAPAEVVREHATDIGADLLVMGAYGHSRLREYLLGGATRDMLADMRLPVLMAH